MSTQQHPLTGLGFIPEQPAEHPLTALGFKPEVHPSEAQQVASGLPQPPHRDILPMDYEGVPGANAPTPEARTAIPPPPPALRPKGETFAQGATREILGHPAAPYVAGGALTALAGPEVGIPAAMGIAAIGGAGEEAAHQIAQHVVTPEEAPKSGAEAATKIGIKGGEAGLAEGGGRLAIKAGGAVIRKVTQPLEEGIQQFFKAAGPPSDPTFRNSIVTAQHDLKNIIDANPITDARRGGIINTDFRIRDFREALGKYMQNMYQTERASQISMGSTAGLESQVRGVNPDVLQFVAKKLSKELPLDSPARAIAERLAQNPSEMLSIADQNELQLATSAELRRYAAGTPQQQAAARTTSKVTSGYESFNNGLKSTMDDLLHSANQPGLASYNERYAALADIQDALSKRMNSSEAIKFIDSAHEYLTPHGVGARVRAGMGNSPGRNLEKGLGKISKNAGPAPVTSGARPYASGAAYGPEAPPPIPPATGIPPPPVAPEYSVEIPGTTRLRSGMNPEQSATTRLGARGTAGTRAPVRGYLPAPPETQVPAQTPVPPPPPTPGFSPIQPPTPGSTGWSAAEPPVKQSPDARNLWGRPVATGDTTTTPGGMISSAPPSGFVKQEFGKLGLSNLVTPRQATTLESMMRGPRWKDMDRPERLAAVRDILSRK